MAERGVMTVRDSAVKLTARRGLLASFSYLNDQPCLKLSKYEFIMLQGTNYARDAQIIVTFLEYYSRLPLAR